MGRPGAKDDPELIEMVEHVVKTGRAAGKAVSVGGVPSTAWQRWHGVGANWFGTSIAELVTSGGRQFCSTIRGG